jgi:hypothetical protein
MAFNAFRAPSLYLNGAKVATINKTSTEISSGDEAQYGDGAILGYSDGIPVTKITADAIIPFNGTPTSIIQAMLAKQYVTIALGVVEGKILSQDMRITSVRIDGDNQKGTLTGQFTFEGGTPTVT